jgi:metal-sulfur cluster biosynthetic enzyme
MPLRDNQTGASSGRFDAGVDAIRDALSTVEDPELGLEAGCARVVYTLTSMGCPLGPMIERDIADALAGLDGVESVETELVFDPPWSPERMSADAKFLLRVYG